MCVCGREERNQMKAWKSDTALLANDPAERSAFRPSVHLSSATQTEETDSAQYASVSYLHNIRDYQWKDRIEGFQKEEFPDRIGSHPETKSKRHESLRSLAR